jgi:hypothetical protein
MVGFCATDFDFLIGAVSVGDVGWVEHSDTQYCSDIYTLTVRPGAEPTAMDLAGLMVRHFQGQATGLTMSNLRPDSRNGDDHCSARGRTHKKQFQIE